MSVTEFTTQPNRGTPGTFSVDSDTFNAELAARIADIETFGVYIESRGQDASAQLSWITGTDYAEGVTVYSELDLLPYTANKDIANSTTDPSLDGGTDWDSAGGVSSADQAKLDLMSANAAVNLDAVSVNPKLVANGAITKGDVVVLEGAGTVKLPEITGEPTSAGTPDQIQAGDAKYLDFIFDGGDALAFFEDTASHAGASASGAVSGTGITWSAETDHAPGDTNSNAYAKSNGSGTICVIYSLVDGGFNDLFARIGTWNGTAFTWGTPVTVYDDTSASNQSQPLGLAYDPDQDCFVALYSVYVGGSTVQLRTKPITYSGTTATAQTESTIDLAAGSNIAILYDTLNNKLVVVYEDGSIAECSIGTNDGTSVSWTTPNTLFTPVNTYMFAPCLAQDDAGEILLIYCDFLGSGTSQLRAAILDPTGTPSIGTPVTIMEDMYGIRSRVHLVYDVSIGKFVAACADSSNGNYLSIIPVATSGATITPGDEVIVISEDLAQCAMAYDTVSEKTWVVGSDGSSSAFRSWHISVDSSSTDAGDWLAIAAEDAADGAEVLLKGIGEVADGLAGMTIGATQYIADDGSLTEVANSRKIGKAVAADKLYITERRAA